MFHLRRLYVKQEILIEQLLAHRQRRQQSAASVEACETKIIRKYKEFICDVPSFLSPNFLTKSRAYIISEQEI